MDKSTAHENARIAAAKDPANAASLALLAATGAPFAALALYGGQRPDPGAAPSGALLVSIPMTARAGVTDNVNHQIVIDTPIEAQITGADEQSGTAATWARIFTPSGGWWADLSVSATGGSGEIKMANTTLYNGAYARVIDAVLQG